LIRVIGLRSPPVRILDARIATRQGSSNPGTRVRMPQPPLGMPQGENRERLERFVLIAAGRLQECANHLTIVANYFSFQKFIGKYALWELSRTCAAMKRS
jgi:hypothetical protein